MPVKSDIQAPAKTAVNFSAAYMRIIVFSCQFLQVQQGLVYIFFQLQGTIQSLQATPPLISIRFLRCTQEIQQFNTSIILQKYPTDILIIIY